MRLIGVHDSVYQRYVRANHGHSFVIRDHLVICNLECGDIKSLPAAMTQLRKVVQYLPHNTSTINILIDGLTVTFERVSP